MSQHKYQIQILKREGFPETLRNMHRPPSSLYMAGSLPAPHFKYLCVIGSRTHSSYGRDACEKLISGLSGHPICVVSGLAIGIDSIAHEAALKAGLPTVAFPGSGLDYESLYPPTRRNLARRIREHGGALLSEYEKGQMGARWTFPNRNRLMAGISHAVLIIEGRRGSGTLGTAQYATDFDRDIMAVPGPIWSDLSYGPHMLIQRGAAMITGAEDILHELGIARRVDIPMTEKESKRGVPGTNGAYDKIGKLDIDALDLTQDEKLVCSLLKIEHLTSTEIIERSSFAASKLNVILSELEIRGVISKNDGKYMMSRP